MQPLQMQPSPYSAQAVRNGFFLTRQIVIVSPPGSGKTTLSDGLATSFGPQRLRQKSAGGFMRVRARELGYGDRIHEFARHMREHPEEGHDKWCDDQVAQLGHLNNLVIDCHLPPFAPYGFTILLECDLTVRAQRRLAKTPDKTEAEVTNELRQRGEDDDAKYAVMYPGSLWPKEDYHLVLDTQKHNAAECLSIVLAAHQAWLAEPGKTVVAEDVLDLQFFSTR